MAAPSCDAVPDELALFKFAEGGATDGAGSRKRLLALPELLHVFPQIEFLHVINQSFYSKYCYSK